MRKIEVIRVAIRPQETKEGSPGLPIIEVWFRVLENGIEMSVQSDTMMPRVFAAKSLEFIEAIEKVLTDRYIGEGLRYD